MMKKRRKAKKSAAPQTQAQLLSHEQISITREVEYIVRRAQSWDARTVTLGRLVLFATGTGDAWIIDPDDNLALCLARGGEKQAFTITETATSFGIGWTANYRIDGQTFTFIEASGQAGSIFGYPTGDIVQAIRRVRR